MLDSIDAVRDRAGPAGRWPGRSRSASAGCASCTRATGPAAARTSLEIYPNLWAGIGLVRGGAGTALVGSHEQVADRIEEYAALGIEEFIFSGYPHLEEAYWFGEGVLPELRRRGAVRQAGAAAARRAEPGAHPGLTPPGPGGNVMAGPLLLLHRHQRASHDAELGV